MAFKHVGRMAKTKRKVIVAYRVVPGDADSCIVVTTENLTAAEHDSLMKAVESPAGQEANDFATVMARAYLPDGRNMLAAFHTTGKMVKVSSSDVELTPNNTTAVILREVLEATAANMGVSIADLAIKDNTPIKEAQPVDTPEIPVDTPSEFVEAAQEAQSEVLTDEELAAKYRSDADRLYKEAKRLREQAEELVPTKRKAKKTEESV